MIISKLLKYRPEIDGLRALAVLSVLFYHVGLGFPGGFVGVDVFFVISGYLITSLLIKDMQEERFSFKQFYERRIRRIFPASFALIFITGVAGFFLLLPSDFISLAKSVVSQTIFGGNFYFWRNTNYFAESAELQPLLHTWSLAVEEQFYMVIPLLLWLIVKIIKNKLKSKLILILSFLFFTSLIFSIYTLRGIPAFTFYLLPTRAWEMLVGSLVSLIPIVPFLKKGYVREVLVFIGLSGMIIPCFLYTNDTLFPGLAAIPPCLGAGFFIIGTTHEENTSLPFTAKLFTWRPIIFIGLISYSLYLWHWPIIAFTNYWALEPNTLFQKILIVLFSFILAIASWRFIEIPFRKKTFLPRQKSIYRFAMATSGVLILFAGLVIFKEGFVFRFNKNVIAFDRAKSEALNHNRISKPVGLEEALAGDFPVFGDSSSKEISVLVWGDSHARSIIPAVIEASQGKNAIAIVWHSSTAPIVGYIPTDRFSEFSLKQKSASWADAVINQVRIKGIQNVILAARWSGYFNAIKEDTKNTPIAIENFNILLLLTIEEIKKAGAKVYILREVPNHKISVPKTLSKAEVFGTDIKKYQATQQSLAKQNAEFDLLQERIKTAGAEIIDVSNLLYDSENDVYMMSNDGEALYYDNHHLTFNGAHSLSIAFKHIFKGQ
jgi:peptidoglycan/LPS O-acetylase OafA/YrhL